MSFLTIFERAFRIARSHLDQPFSDRDFDEQLRRAEELIEESRRRDQGQPTPGEDQDEPREPGEGSSGSSRPRTELKYDAACKVLGVHPGSTQAQIAAVYRKRIRELHPDRHVHLSPEEQARAHRLTQELNNAYEFLKRNPRT